MSPSDTVSLAAERLLSWLLALAEEVLEPDSSGGLPSSAPAGPIRPAPWAAAALLQPAVLEGARRAGWACGLDEASARRLARDVRRSAMMAAEAALMEGAGQARVSAPTRALRSWGLHTSRLARAAALLGDPATPLYGSQALRARAVWRQAVVLAASRILVEAARTAALDLPPDLPDDAVARVVTAGLGVDTASGDTLDKDDHDIPAGDGGSADPDDDDGLTTDMVAPAVRRLRATASLLNATVLLVAAPVLTRGRTQAPVPPPGDLCGVSKITRKPRRGSPRKPRRS